MGLMDKVKAQATQLAQKTQDAANTGMAKFDSAQTARRYDPMLKSLGLAVLADRTGRGGPDSAAQVDQLIASLTQFEAQNNLNIVDHARVAQAQAQSAQMGGGDYLSSAPGVDPNVPASYPGAAPAAGFPGADPATGFPGAAPAAGFPEPASFPGAAPAAGFPEPASFPGAAPAAGFPEATAFPAASPEPEATDEAPPPDAPMGFPPSGFPPTATG
jgi:hypothetical protein